MTEPMRDHKNMILWIDLETTGLSARQPTSAILECAAILTDASLEIVDSISRVMAFNDDTMRLLLDPYVQDMHTDNGLWDACKEAQDVPADLQFDIRTMLHDNGVGPQEALLGGSSINFDREWIEEFMPALFDYLHYRNVDVSTLKTLTKMWRPDISGILPASDGNHRATSDIIGTIELAKLFRAHIFDPTGRFYP